MEQGLRSAQSKSQQEASSCGEPQATSFLSQHRHLQGQLGIAPGGATQRALKRKTFRTIALLFFLFFKKSFLFISILSKGRTKVCMGVANSWPYSNNTHSFQIQGNYIFTPNLPQTGLHKPQRTNEEYKDGIH